MDADEHLCRSPATIVTLRPVTLRPYLSLSLPSGCRILIGLNRVKAYGTDGLLFPMSGKTGEISGDG